MRGTSPGDPQSRDVPFAGKNRSIYISLIFVLLTLFITKKDPSKEDISAYTIGFSDNSDTQGWPEAWDTPFLGKRGNVLVNSL